MQGGQAGLELGQRGLVAGGALMGVLFAFLNIPTATVEFLKKVGLEENLVHAFGQYGFYLIGLLFFALMGYMLYRNGMKKTQV